MSFGPSLITAYLMKRSSTSSVAFCERAAFSAFATADLMTFSICFAACFFENAR